MSERCHRIYALIDPRTDAVRYVGVTLQQIALRLRTHCRCARHDSPCPVHQWIRDLLNVSLAPAIRLLEETEDRDREAHWIQYYQQREGALLNVGNGGGRIPGPKARGNEFRLMVYLDHAGALALADHCEKHNLTRAGAVRAALRAMIERDAS